MLVFFPILSSHIFLSCCNPVAFLPGHFHKLWYSSIHSIDLTKFYIFCIFETEPIFGSVPSMDAISSYCAHGFYWWFNFKLKVLLSLMWACPTGICMLVNVSCLIILLFTSYFQWHTIIQQDRILSSPFLPSLNLYISMVKHLVVSWFMLSDYIMIISCAHSTNIIFLSGRINVSRER